MPDIEGNDSSSATYYCANSSSVARVVYVRNATVEGEGSVVFIEADHDANAIKDSDGNFYELNAVVDGEITTIKVKTGTPAARALVTNANSGDPYMVAYKSLVKNSDDLVTDVRTVASENELNGTGTGEYERNDATVGLIDDDGDMVYYTYSDDVVVVYYDGDDLRTSRITSVGEDDNDSYIAILDDGQIIGLCITEKDDGEQDDDAKTPEGVRNVDLSSRANVKVYVYEDTDLSDDQAIEAVAAALEDEGYTVRGIEETNTDEYSFEVTNGSLTRTFQFDYNSGIVTVYQITGVTTDNPYLDVKANTDEIATGDEIVLTLTKKDGTAFGKAYTGASLTGVTADGTPSLKMSSDNKTATVTFTADTVSDDCAIEVSLTE